MRARAVVALVVPVILGLCAAAALSADEVAVKATCGDGRVRVWAHLLTEQQARLVGNLRGGLQAQVSFQFLPYERSKGWFSFLGDRLLKEQNASRIASFDIFADRFSIQSEDGAVAYYDSEQPFLEAFLSVEALPLAPLEVSDASRYYVLARVRLEPVKLIPPLNIIAGFAARGTVASYVGEAAVEPAVR